VLNALPKTRREVPLVESRAVGAFYDSIHVATKDRPSIVTVLNELRGQGLMRFFVGPLENGWVGVYPSEQDLEGEVARELAERTKRPVIALAVYDSDYFIYRIYLDGSLLEAASSPGGEIGIPGAIVETDDEKGRAFADLLGDEKRIRKWRRLLSRLRRGRWWSYLAFGGWLIFWRLPLTRRLRARLFRQMRGPFADSHLFDAADILGIKNAATSYDYLDRGDDDGVTELAAFEHIPARHVG